MSAWPTARKHGDLLIAPEVCRSVIRYKGVDWVSDRFVIARTDLWAKPVGPRSASHIDLTTDQLRKRLAEARTNTLRPAEIAREDECAVLRVGWALHGINAATWDGWNRIACAKASATYGWISWWQLRRGREVLVGVQAGIRLAWPMRKDGVAA